ncbi:ataxin-2-like [Pseudonaja textilis]|uniref:ataxin-2-like n=1 Tax=Pseudonaja textilis TaxID=8673 RepID=UPI000EA9D363|nr:ataxin-2-like [Pseudonaja textilis]
MKRGANSSKGGRGGRARGALPSAARKGCVCVHVCVCLFPTALSLSLCPVSTGSLAQQYAHPSATLHPHSPHPQPSATPTGQQQTQHGGNHPAPSPVQAHQHQAAQALHLSGAQQQSALYHTGLAPTPPAMVPGSSAQSPQSSFPAAQQTVFAIHPSHVQPAYTNPPHMAHVPQAHVQSGMAPSHPSAHAPVMLMTTQPPPGGPQAIAQSALQHIPVSSATHFPYMTHPSVPTHHQQQL